MRKLLLVSAALFLAAGAVYGQGAANSVELTPTAGYWWGDTIHGGTINGVNTDVTIADAPSYGLRMTYKATPAFGVELFLSKGNADLRSGYGGLFGGSKVGTMDVGVGEINFEFAFGHSRLVPFIVGGFGAIRLSPSFDSPAYPRYLSADTRFTGDFGGGMKMFFSPQVALRLDLRWHSVDIGDNYGCGWYEHCDNYYYHYNWLTFTEAGLGLSFVL